MRIKWCTHALHILRYNIWTVFLRAHMKMCDYMVPLTALHIFSSISSYIFVCEQGTLKIKVFISFSQYAQFHCGQCHFDIDEWYEKMVMRAYYNTEQEGKNASELEWDKHISFRWERNVTRIGRCVFFIHEMGKVISIFCIRKSALKTILCYNISLYHS